MKWQDSKQKYISQLMQALCKSLCATGQSQIVNLWPNEELIKKVFNVNEEPLHYHAFLMIEIVQTNFPQTILILAFGL